MCVCVCGFCNVCVCVSMGFVMCGCVYVCVCNYGFCNVRVCVCVGFVMCGCFDNCVGVLVICVLVFTVFMYCFVHVYLFVLVTGLRTTATE